MIFFFSFVIRKFKLFRNKLLLLTPFILAPHIEFSKPLHDVEVVEKETAKFECEVSRENVKVCQYEKVNDWIYLFTLLYDYV